MNHPIFLNIFQTDPSIWEMLLRVGLTAVFVGIIGAERQMRHKIAGVTTHLMVAFGACGIAIMQELLYHEALALALELASQGITVNLERQRVIAQIVVGVGFLGAGTILKTSSGIYGLTTAATLWLGAMIGLIFGMGAYSLGIVLSVVSFIFLTFIRKLLEAMQMRHVKSPEILGAEIIEK
ncbi:MAG: MgtC/SapB family protein [Bacillus subtilis]|nr:MgtC/SapB family protein [Bacillus subtilis]